MAVVYSPNVIEIAVIQALGARPVVNVWHMWFSAEGSGKTITDVVEDFRNNWQDHMTVLSTPELTISRFDWRSLDQSNTTLGSVAVNASKPQAGVTGSSAMPPNVATLVEKTTTDRPRGRKDGRSYIAGLPDGFGNAAGVLAADQLATFNAAVTAFYNGISDTAWDASGDRYPVVLETTPASRAPGTAAVTIQSRRVTSLSVDPVLATQRDRLR